jgi:hypothetical protein
MYIYIYAYIYIYIYIYACIEDSDLYVLALEALAPQLLRVVPTYIIYQYQNKKLAFEKKTEALAPQLLRVVPT